MKKKRIVHLITGLNNGGAETMLYKILKYFDKTQYEIEVISMLDKGFYGKKIEDLGIKVHCLNFKKKFNIKSFLRVCKIIKDADVLQTWMYHANLLGYILTRFFPVKKIIWGIHHSNLDKDKNKLLTLKIAKLCAYVSSEIDHIISCSDTATNIHIDYKYDSNKIITIYNGFEINSYKYDENAREILFNELGIKNNPFIISLVARWHILKDHNTFFNALNILIYKYNIKNFTAILCGTNIDYNNKELLSMISKYKLESKVKLLGIRNDIPKIMSASDILVLSSSGEAFPNVIGEAMACSTPCVVTDVGDCAFIVGDTGLVVERRNPLQLAKAIKKMMEMNEKERFKLGIRARERIVKNFNITDILKKYEILYKS